MSGGGNEASNLKWTHYIRDKCTKKNVILVKKNTNERLIVKKRKNKNLTRQKQPRNISNIRFGLTLIITFIFIGSLYLLSDINPQSIDKKIIKKSNSLVIEDKSITNSKAVSYDFHEKLKKDKVSVDYLESPTNKEKKIVSNYFIQAGSFKSIEKAEILLVELKLLGFEPFIKSIINKNNEKVYRVQLGPYDFKKMSNERNKLFKNNFESIILKN